MSRTATQKMILDAEDIVWTPPNMTQSQVLEQLPFVFQLLMTSAPTRKTLIRLRHFHAEYVKDGHIDLALLAARCIERAEQLIAPEKLGAQV